MSLVPDRMWQIREGIGLVLPMDSRLIEFNKLDGITPADYAKLLGGKLSRLELELASAHLKVAKHSVERLINMSSM